MSSLGGRGTAAADPLGVVVEGGRIRGGNGGRLRVGRLCGSGTRGVIMLLVVVRLSVS